MSNNEIVLTFKGRLAHDPWVVVHADTPAIAEEALNYLSANFIAKVHSFNEHFQAGEATAQLVPPPAQAFVAPPVEQSPQQYEQPAPQVAVASSAPVQQAAPPQQAPAQGTPEGVVIWTGPQPGKPQYQATFYQVPFIGDKATRDAFNAELKNGAWAKPLDTTTKPWTFIAPKGGTEQLVRDTIARYAQQGAFSG